MTIDDKIKQVIAIKVGNRYTVSKEIIDKDRGHYLAVGEQVICRTVDDRGWLWGSPVTNPHLLFKISPTYELKLPEID